MVEVHEDAAAATTRAADLLIGAARAAVAERGRFTVALSGGVTPRGLYTLLAGVRSGELPWEACEFFFGDERCVPPDDERSNYRNARQMLFEPARVPASRVRRMEGELPPKTAALRYEATLREAFGAAGLPTLDFALQGLGADGHTASLFPGSPALHEARRWVVASEAPVEPRGRLTLTLPVLNAARRVVFLVAGAAKAQAARLALSTASVPAALVRPSGQLYWLFDAPAASCLR